MKLRLAVLPGRFGICRLDSDSPVPALRGSFSSLTVTEEEVSLVCEEDRIPAYCRESVTGYRVLRVHGPLDLSLVGILASLSRTLADSGISVFCISTFRTDYLLVRCTDLTQAVEALRAAGHRVDEAP